MVEKQSRYQVIAFELAKRIANEEIKEGDKLRGRSVLSSEYNVSSETIRKAMRLLSNLGVVEVKERSGIYVLSKEASLGYINTIKERNIAHNLLIETYKLLEESKALNKKLSDNIQELVTSTKKDVFPFDFFTCEIKEDYKAIGKSIAALDFQTLTGGIVLALDLRGHFIQAPNPHTPLESGMVLYVLGDESVKQKTLTYLKNLL